MTWLIVAYALVWIAFFLYAFGLDRKQRKFAAELNELKSKLGQ